jgi:hypothetical protein
MTADSVRDVSALGSAASEIQALTAMVSDAHIPKLYMQAFASFASPVDVTVVALVANAPTGVISMGYPAAKSLCQALQTFVDSFEKATGVPVVTGEEAQRRMQVASQAKE